MSSAAVSTHSGAGPLGLMSCVRESSPLQDFDSDTEKSVATKKKFWNRLKWFKRKNKVIEDSVLPVSDYIPTSESLRSRSTSELSIEEPPRKRNGSSMYPGLSVSHDSVFHSPQSGSETDLDVGHSSSSLCIPTQPHAAELQTELSERLRLRRSGGGRGDTSEDDEGFPHSICNSPTTTDNIDKTALKDLPNKSHSTCSDGSLLSVGSSDIEEDLLISQIRYSSKLSLSEKKHDLDLKTTSMPLNHSAAHHRVAVRPKKTHGVPRRRRVQQLPNTLPTTIEVNEDSSIRSSSPEANSKVPPGSDNKLNRSKSNAGSKSQDALEEHAEKEEKCDKSFFERLFPRRSAKKKKAKHDEKKQEEKKIKLEETSVKHDDKKIEDRRKSEDVRSSEIFKPITDKYSSREEMFTSSIYSKQMESSNRRYETKPVPAVRSGAAYRQRVIPVDIQDSPDAPWKEEEEGTTIKGLPDILSTSPLHLELENKLKQRLTLSSPPQSMDYTDVNVEHKEEIIGSSKPPRFFEGKPEESKHKIKLAGLSSLQQKVLILNEDEGDFHNFKSLTEFPTSSQSSNVHLTKSHSFKSTKSSSQSVTTSVLSSNRKTDSSVDPKEISMGKSSSLDSMKWLDTTEQIQRSSTQMFTERIEHQRQIKQQTVEIKCDITVDQKDNIDEEVAKQIMETKSISDNFPDKSHITISGPSHTAVVNVKNNSEYFSLTEETLSKVETHEKHSPKEQLISITKINVQPEIEELSPRSPVILESKSIFCSKSPKRFSEQLRTRPVFNFDIDKQPNVQRKFSQENVEIVDKDSESPKTPPIFAVPSMGPLFKKNEKSVKKTSLVSVSPESPTKDKSITSFRSSSCDSLASDHFDSTDRSSQDSLDNVIDKSRDKSESVVLRKKSSVKESRDEEPELMKVFARRSLKLKDPENETISQQLSVMMNEYCDKARDSDKENQTDSPVRERKKSKENMKIEIVGTKSTEDEPQLRKKHTSKSDDEDANSLQKKPLIFELEKKEKEPLIESNVPHSKPIPIIRNSRSENHSLENVEVTLRKPVEQNSSYIRSVSVNTAKNIDNSQNILRKQFISRRRTDNWITNIKNEDSEKDKEVKDEDVTKEQTGNDLIIEPKNFNQRKAEWEKRAQEAKKKSP